MSKKSIVQPVETTEAPKTDVLVTTAPAMITVEQTVPVEEQKPVEPKYSDLMEQFKTKSAVIRHLDGLGWKRGAIAKFMNIKYQFVRNVLITPVKKPVEQVAAAVPESNQESENQD